MARHPAVLWLPPHTMAKSPATASGSSPMRLSPPMWRCARGGARGGVNRSPLGSEQAGVQGLLRLAGRRASRGRRRRRRQGGSEIVAGIARVPSCIPPSSK